MIKHFPSCNPNYPEKPEGEAAQPITYLDGYESGIIIGQCGDCGAFTKYKQESPDANVETNRDELLQRSILGLKKYGTTTERTDLNISQWLQHAIEEALDFANYLQAAKSNINDPNQNLKRLFEVVHYEERAKALDFDSLDSLLKHVEKTKASSIKAIRANDSPTRYHEPDDGTC